MRQPLDQLAAAVGHRFADPRLLENALTHRSAGSGNNERLEFLGDAVLSFVIAEELYRRFPEADEGSLSRLRASLVKGETLAKVARALAMGDYLRLGSGELKSGGFRRESILADALEALLGAVYLDAGIDAVRGIILNLYEERLRNASPRRALKDPKTRLQELLQGRHCALPVYSVVSLEGEAHAQQFRVGCEVEGLGMIEAEGSSRRKAEQAAATRALQMLGEQA